MRSDPSVCSRCARLGGACCSLTPGREEACFPLSPSEVEHIRDVFPDTGGFALQGNTLAFQDMLCRLFPGEEESVSRLFPLGREHTRLATTPSGDCRFLSASGCRLPRESRPYYCRLFPLWQNGDAVTLLDHPGCLARREGVSVAGLLEHLKTSAPRVRDLYGRLRLAWGLPPVRGMRLVEKSF